LSSKLQIGQVFRIEIPVRLRHIRIESDWIGACDDGFLERHVFKIAARRSVAKQDAVAIHDGERGEHEAGEVDKALVDLLMQTAPLPAQDSIPVLHPQRHAAKAVMFGDGQVDDLVGLEKRSEHGPALQHHSTKIDLAKQIGIGQDHLGPRGPRSRFDAGPMETAARFVAAHIRHNHTLRAGLPALTNDFSDKFGIRVRGLFRCAVPGDVRFDDNYIVTPNKPAHPAQIFQHPLYPYSGAIPLGTNMVNVPVAPYTRGPQVRALIEENWMAPLEAFRPEMIFVSAGFDAHREDELGQLGLVEADYAWITERIKAVADKHARGRIVSCLEGGYNLGALARSVAAHLRVLLAA